MKKNLQFFTLSLFFIKIFCLKIKENTDNKTQLNNFIDNTPNVVIAVNKPHAKYNFSTAEYDNAQNAEKQTKLQHMIAKMKELLKNIDDDKNILLENSKKEDELNVETEIINANDENVLNLLLNNENENLEKKGKKNSSPIIIVFPQLLTNQELLYYEKYKGLMKDLKKTKNLLLKVSYFEKLSTIKSRDKSKIDEEIEETKEIIEKSISRIHAINELLEEIHDEHNEDKNTIKIKNEQEFLNEKINVLNKKIRKLSYITKYKF